MKSWVYSEDGECMGLVTRGLSVLSRERIYTYDRQDVIIERSIILA